MPSKLSTLLRVVMVPVLAASLMCCFDVAIASAEDAPPKPLKITADLGYVSTAGNSEVQTLTATEKLESRHGAWLLTQDAGAVWGTDHGVENAGRYLLGLRADRDLSKRVSLYALGSWRRNTFAAIKRQFDEGVGLAFHALTPSPHQLDLEAGAGLSQRETTLGVSDDFGTARFAALYRYYFKEKTYAEANGIYLANLKTSDDYEYDLKAALVAPLANILALKLGYNYHNRNAPPAGFKKWDSTFAAGLQITY
jgi:putative salt-induced outer membrane protein YdiY